MCLVTFWKCYFPPPPTQNPPPLAPHNRKTTKTPPPTPPQQQQKNQRSKRESKKSKSHRNVDRFVGRSKSHKKSKSHRERDRFVGSWREGFGSPVKSKALGRWQSRRLMSRRLVSRRLVSRRLVSRRLVSRRLWVEDRFVDRWVEGFGSKIGSWVRRSAKSKAWSGLWVRRRSWRLLSLSLSFCAWVRKWFEVKILTETNFRVKSIKAHGQLKIFSGKFIFHAQPNTRIYGKAFSKVIWSQNKHSLSWAINYFFLTIL